MVPPPSAKGDLALVGKWLEDNAETVERWLREEASKEFKQKVQSAVFPLQPVRNSSISSDIFQLLWAASPVCNDHSLRNVRPERDYESLEKCQLFMELIRDVANEIDINLLCYKIIRNVSILTHADRGSLFLTRTSNQARYLVAKLFDVRPDTSFDEAMKLSRSEELKIPFGVGIAGTVAQNKKMINIRDAYKDPRFNNEIDLRTGYKTNMILCMPICNFEGDVIGVAQIINKTNDSQEFTQQDVELFQLYITFCGIGIHNAQLFEVSDREHKKNQILLNLARSIFEEQNNLQCLVTKIMREAQNLLNCERCAVYLLNLDCCEANHLERIVERPGKIIQRHGPLHRAESGTVTAEDMRENGLRMPTLFTTVFELREYGKQTLVSRPSSFDLASSTLAQIAGYAASTGQILNIGDVKSWLKEKHSEGDAESARTILCMPIINGQRSLIGVAQLINKENYVPFTEYDVSLFEAFAIFCGLGIHNTQMYENACKLMAKQKVALECLSYHATASNEATEKLRKEDIPSASFYNLYSFTFIDFELSDDDTCKATIRMFMECNLVQEFHIPYEVLCRWILSVKKNYRPVKYHNWRHALNVAQTMFAMFKTGKMERFMSDLEILGLIVACLCHDLDHRGTNNAFQMKTDSPLAVLYSTSTMEHHHFDQCVMILNTDSNNIFQALSPEDYRKVMRLVETAILSTDLAMYFKKKNKFLELIENGEFDWQSEDKKELLSGMMMTACDVSAIAKPWEVQHRVAKLVADEFFDQGDLERMQLKEQPVVPRCLETIEKWTLKL
ncbi:phosphodiesterase 6 isoform X2 [Leptinotarsa decemlineata]|uniref:phosphodiesterase 6 isoform X2 n=1 Tax=Leptinotarsa decemlineata TaxID=7539 RepID=UPI003D30B69E